MAEEEVAPKIVQLMPADGWWVRWDDLSDAEPLIAWALVEFDTGLRYVTGVYVFGSATEIVGWFDGKRDDATHSYYRPSE